MATEARVTSMEGSNRMMMLGAFLKDEGEPSNHLGHNNNGNDKNSNPQAQSRQAHFELRKTPIPELEAQRHPPGSMLLRTVAASICGSDFCGQGPSCAASCQWRKSLDHIEYLKSNQICGGTGHELLGEVVQVVEPCKYKVGQRLLAMSTMYMKLVILDVFQQESGLQDVSMFDDQGGFAEYLISHDSVCLAVPTTATTTTTTPSSLDSPPSFVLAQPLATVLHAAKDLPNLLGKTVVIVGQGQNGLLMTKLLSGFQPQHLIVLDLLQERLDIAKKHCGATHTIQVQHYYSHNKTTFPAKSEEEEEATKTMISTTASKFLEHTNGQLADVVVEMVGHQHASMDLSVALAKKHGTIVLFGLPPGQIHTQFAIRGPGFAKNLHYQTSSGPGMESFRLAVDLLAQGRFQPPPGLISHTLPFQDFARAYDMAQTYQDGVIKVLLTFQEEE